MSRTSIERRLTDVSQRLSRARHELTVLDEQLVLFADTADETRVRALVSDEAGAAREHTEAARHADAMARSRAALVELIARLQQQQDELLEQLPQPAR